MSVEELGVTAKGMTDLVTRFSNVWRGNSSAICRNLSVQPFGDEENVTSPQELRTSQLSMAVKMEACGQKGPGSKVTDTHIAGLKALGTAE